MTLRPVAATAGARCHARRRLLGRCGVAQRTRAYTHQRESREALLSQAALSR
jgi:hypothetical protein